MEALKILYEINKDGLKTLNSMELFALKQQI